VYFSWRQEKYQKNRALRLGLRLPSLKRVFRRGQELARLRRCSNSLTAVFRKTRLRSAAPQRAMGPSIDVRPGRTPPVIAQLDWAIQRKTDLFPY